MVFISVDLPDPEGPMSARYSPFSTRKVAFSKATTFTSPKSLDLCHVIELDKGHGVGNSRPASNWLRRAYRKLRSTNV